MLTQHTNAVRRVTPYAIFISYVKNLLQCMSVTYKVLKYCTYISV